MSTPETAQSSEASRTHKQSIADEHRPHESAHEDHPFPSSKQSPTVLLDKARQPVSSPTAKEGLAGSAGDVVMLGPEEAEHRGMSGLRSQTPSADHPAPEPQPVLDVAVDAPVASTTAETEPCLSQPEAEGGERIPRMKTFNSIRTPEQRRQKSLGDMPVLSGFGSRKRFGGSTRVRKNKGKTGRRNYEEIPR